MNLVSLAFYRPNSLACLGARHAAIGDEVDEIVCLHGQSLEVLSELCPELPLDACLVVERFVDSAPHVLDELRSKLHRSVMIDDRIIDKVEGEMTRVASAFLPPAAEEVEVLGLIPSNRALDDHATVGDPALYITFAAPDGSLEVVRVDALSLPGASGRFKSLLDPLK
ncbi:hypothetical protein [Glaciibacter psychrotolerans]|uniref:hypothetical protein n=1 Tax=Glaciibacter psychrotolerans TaxID=670054 RepID=UPI0015C882CB|nr:hypothetical protein [Leifsonia psychrotolerans]